MPATATTRCSPATACGSSSTTFRSNSSRGSEIDYVEELVGALFHGAQPERGVDLRLRGLFRGRMTRIATWNVNSIRARLPRVLEWLAEFSPDIVLVQELKATEETFPHEAIEEAGYNVAICGQKNFNGVGIFAKHPIEDLRTGLPGDPDDEQARYIEAFVGDLRVASIYLPNGNPGAGRQVRLQAALDGPALRAHERPPASGGGAGAGRRLQCRSDR